MEVSKKTITRYITALVGLPAVAFVLAFGHIVLIDIVFAIIAIMSIHEYFDGFKKTANPVRWLGYLSCVFIAFIHIIPREYLIHAIGIVIPVFILLLFIQVIASGMKTNIKDIAITLFGILYIPVFLMFIPIVIGLQNGKFLVWFILLGAWATDSGAYIIGKTLGKHKFSTISPNKTIEGCIGGVVFAVVTLLVYSYCLNTFAGMQIPYWGTLIIGIVLSILSQIGDFAASSIKRYVRIKDYSNLIPGHGGMMDRIDSVIFIAPFAYFLLTWIL